MVVLNDFFLYWGHRIQHESRFLWQFHAVHHRFRTPRPLTTANIHPIDATLQGGLPIVISAIICQPHPWLLYTFLFLRTSENVMNHCGSDAWWVSALKSSWLPLRAGVDHHDRHHFVSNHAKQATNYGESFIMWDWMFGTLANKNTLKSS
jgi:sterol desaturase/sphingolipid hydroxylase (fatty acid hydroxylase superfamily)